MSGPPRPTPLLWTPRAAALVLTGSALVVVAVALRSPVPLFLALPLLLAPVAAAISGPRERLRATARVSAGGSGPDVLLHGTVRLRSEGSTADLWVRVDRPPGIEETAPVRSAADGRTVELDWSWRTREPSIAVVPPLRVAWTDAAGLVTREADVESEPYVLERYPPELLRVGSVRLHRTVTLPGETPSRHLGSSGEFHGLREATALDPPRRINWKASARAGRRLVNEFRTERTADVVLFLDTRPSTLGPAVDERLLGISRAAAAGIAASFLREKSRVGLGVFGEFLDVVPLGLGRAHASRLRAALVASRVGSSSPPAERGAVAATRYFPPGVTVLLISPLADEASSELVPHLRRRGYPVIVLSPSPIPALLGPGPADDEESRLVARLSRLLRRERLAATWNYAPTVDWEEYWSLAGFVDFLNRPPTRRHG